MAASVTDIEEFLSGPLVSWLMTCVKKPESLQVYETFFDGAPVNEVLLQIDPEPSQPVPSIANLHGLSIVTARIKIFNAIVRNLKAVYEDELGQVIISLPDCITLGRAPASQSALDEMKLLLLLLLGCAVQGPTKEIFITRIKSLSVEVQHDIVECIKQVTDDQRVVLTLDWTEQSAERLYSHIRHLTGDRDKLMQQWMSDLSQETTVNSSSSSTAIEGIESNHLAVKLADWKARLRKQRQELEEKSELLAECKEELEHANSLVTKLKSENTDLLSEARRAKAYRDEVDAMRERAERADKLEVEVQRYREKLADAEFYKVRVDELRDDNRVLLETREMLESQLAHARQRADHAMELEAELLSCKQKINDIALERDAARERVQELIDENIQMQQLAKSALQETSSLSFAADDSETEETNSGDNSLSEQLTNNAQARAFKLELENRKLLSMIDTLKEHNFKEGASKILELEKEKKKLTLKTEQQHENLGRLTQQNNELENLFKNALQENRKLHTNLDTVKSISDRQSQDLQNERAKVAELTKNTELINKEKQRVQSLCETIKKRADDAEKSLSGLMEQLQGAQAEIEKGVELEKLRDKLENRVATFEKENVSLQKEIGKLKELIEAKDVNLDQHLEKCQKQEEEIVRLLKEIEMSQTCVEKLQDFEHRSQELLSQGAVQSETISTLQKDLVSEKLINEKVKTSLEKLGLTLDILDNDINVILEKMLTIPEIEKGIQSLVQNWKTEDDNKTKEKCANCTETRKMIESDVYTHAEEVVSTLSAEWNQQCEKLLAEVATQHQLNETLQADNARMQVDIATLTSQINSLTTQQTALQLANSQLAAEKEELGKQQQIQSNQHDTLLLDQVTLRTLHEQLSSEYEELKLEQESLRKLNRDLRSEIRTLKDKDLAKETVIATIEQEKVALKNESKSLGNLRAEHSKLKDDFRNLFTASERMKIEYRNLQDEYRKLRMESGKLRLGQTEMQGELNTQSDLVAGLQLENAKLQQKCDMLYDMNTSLDSDRRALMEHVSQLLKQYHTLLTHSLEDKEHFHLEEKLFTDKLNNLCRQKEKLEEKIMDHYRKLDNASSSKKRSFGATLVRKVRKAGSDIINKVPNRNRRSWHEDAGKLTQSAYTIGGGSGESGGNDSDISVEDSGNNTARPDVLKRSGGSLHGQKSRDEITMRRSYRDLTTHRSSISGDQIFPQDNNSMLSLGSVGSRRTVYLSEDEPVVTPPVAQAQQPNNSPMVVYNRISTVIGETKQQEPVQVASSAVEEKGDDMVNERKRSVTAVNENAIWYEYGCV